MAVSVCRTSCGGEEGPAFVQGRRPLSIPGTATVEGSVGERQAVDGDAGVTAEVRRLSQVSPHVQGKRTGPAGFNRGSAGDSRP